MCEVILLLPSLGYGKKPKYVRFNISNSYKLRISKQNNYHIYRKEVILMQYEFDVTKFKSVRVVLDSKLYRITGKLSSKT